MLQSRRSVRHSKPDIYEGGDEKERGREGMRNRKAREGERNRKEGELERRGGSRERMISMRG
jgi:hypothetical protein